MDKELTIACGMETSKGNFECDELIELLKKTVITDWQTSEKRLFWDSKVWVAVKREYRKGNKNIYSGDSLIEALKVLTRGD